MTSFFRIIFICFAWFFSGSSFAFTSIAMVDGQMKTFGRAYNYSTQKDADKSALSICRKEAKAHGLAKLSKKCAVISRATQPGYGAIVCAGDFCAWSMGQQTPQIAADSAYANCSQRYTNCQTTNITSWSDFNGFNRQQQNATQQPSSLPTLSDRYDAIRKAQFKSRFDGAQAEPGSLADQWLNGGR